MPIEASLGPLYRPDGLTVWKNGHVRERLPWYRAVMDDEKPAKFLICKKVPTDLPLAEASEEELWQEHERLSRDSADVQDRISSGSLSLDQVETPEVNFLDLKVEILYRLLRHCTFCEWRCGVDRSAGKTAVCRLDHKTRVATFLHHFGEEAPLVGTGGSGTIFFSSCNLHCAFCQNWDISQDPDSGAAISPLRLALIMKSLREEGAANINFVGGEPTPNLHTIVDAMRYLTVSAPMLWNSNMYCSLEAMRILADVIDIWLPDFKYGNDSCALKLSKVPTYWSIVSRNHLRAYESSDMIIRHLVLPTHLECCTRKVLEWISQNCPRALVNVMGQYRPDYLVERFPERYPAISRRLTPKELHEAYATADKLGIIYEPVS